MSSASFVIPSFMFRSSTAASAVSFSTEGATFGGGPPLEKYFTRIPNMANANRDGINAVPFALRAYPMYLEFIF